MSSAHETSARAATVTTLGNTIPTDAEIAPQSGTRWGMVIDLDRCTGCQACVVACQAENNISLNEENRVLERRAKTWIRIERYWDGEFPNAKARFIPVLCQHCGNAPCETVCPVWATYHSPGGLNVQVYNRCVGTRFCANGCPYSVRYFNFWNPEWPEPMNNQLNPDVTVRTKGIVEKCSFCVQRINRTRVDAKTNGHEVADGDIQPACVQSCPTTALVFGDLNDPSSKAATLAESDRRYTLLENFGTDPGVVYLKKVDPHATHHNETQAASEKHS
jgi:molybdopterin-containing oxidoreductase family iron-sulfur binding subunit